MAPVERVTTVKRAGTGSDTKYKFRLQRQLSPAEASERAAAGAVSNAGGGAGPSAPPDDDIPF